MASLNILGIGDEEPGNLLSLSPPLSDGTPRGVQQIPERDALARLYNNVTSMIDRPAVQGLLAPIWNPANPVGTERLREQFLTSSEGKPFIPLRTEAYGSQSAWLPPGTVPVTEARHEGIREGSLSLFDQASQLVGGPGQIGGGQAPARMFGRVRVRGGTPLESRLDRNAPGFRDRISTRTPSEVQVPDVHTNSDYQVGVESFNASEGGAKVPYQQRTADLISQQPGFERFKDGNYGSPDEVHEAYTSFLESNLRRLHGEVAATPWGKAASGWYTGANKAVTDTAKTYDLLPRQAAGMAARLSPGTPWDMNMAQFNRTVDVVSKHSDSPMTEAMQKLYRDKYGAEFQHDGKANPEYKPKWAGNWDELSRPGRTLKDLEGPDAGLFVRLFDEAHNPNFHEYRLVNPDGTYGAIMPDKYTPNSNGNIGQAISIMRNGSLDNISRELGEGHKIRSFYNNIVSPHAGSDVTIDTHAMAAANLMPWGASRPEVAYGFGNSPQTPVPPHPHGAGAKWLTGAKGGAPTGSDGLYPLYAEAYRRVAHDLGIHPRELQSMTWEGVKGLYKPADRRGRRGDAIMNENSDMWRAYENGTRTIEDVQSTILGRGIGEPEWWARRGTPGDQWKPVDYRLP